MQRGGQPLSYLNPNVYEPSFREGSDILQSMPRPAIPVKGGFTPSIMGNLVQNGAMLVPLASLAAHRMMSNKTKKLRGGMKNWETLRDEAKRDLSAIGKASAVNINRLASIRKRGESNAAFLEDFSSRKGNVIVPIEKVEKVEKIERAKTPALMESKAKTTWQENRKKAKNFLTVIGKPSGPNIVTYASMTRKGKNTSAFLNDFKSRLPKVTIPKATIPKATIPKATIPKATIPKATIPKASRAKTPVLLPSPKVMQPPIIPQETTKALSTKALSWKENKERAKEFLSQYGKPTGANLSRFASIRRKSNANAEREFINSLQSRPKTAQPSVKRRMSQSERKEADAEEEEKEVLRIQQKEKTNSNSTEQWRLNRERAKDLLQRIGSATAAEISKLASMMRKKENTSEFLNTVRTRVNQTRKRLTLLKQKNQEKSISIPKNETEAYTLSSDEESKEYEPFLNNSPASSLSLPPSQPSSAPTYVPLESQPTYTRKVQTKNTIQNFRKHLQLLKQKLQREKV